MAHSNTEEINAGTLVFCMTEKILNQELCMLNPANHYQI